MTKKSFPNEIILSVGDYHMAGVEEIIRDVDGYRDCVVFFDLFNKKAKELLSLGKLTEGKVFSLLASSCSFDLNPSSPNEPFKPWIVQNGRSSAIPNDFSKNDVDFLESTIPVISEFHLRARIADICWYLIKPRKPEYALIAIDAYMQHQFDDNEHLYESESPLERAIFLCRLHRKITKVRYLQIHDYLINTLHASIYNTCIFSKVSDLLLQQGIEKNAEVIISDIFEAVKNAKFESKRKLLEDALEWITRLNRIDTRIFEIHCKIAESYEDQAACATASMFSAGLYHKAIIEYQKIPKRVRQNYVSAERLKELSDLVTGTNQQATTEMSPIISPPINLTQSVEASREYVMGRPFPEVLFAFAYLCEVQEKEKYRERAIKSLSEHIFLAVTSTTHYSIDSRPISKSPETNREDASNESYEYAIWEQMMSEYHLHVSLCVDGAIIHGLDVINAEHRITLPMLVGMCRASTIVPDDRVLVWAKGIYFGFERDFMSAVHLLTPQVEHYVRINLKRNGIKTTTTDLIGVETENGLGTLLENIEINKAFDDNFMFELKAIYTDSLGFNLRNDIAHGLVDSDLGRTCSAIYAWWFCLRLVLSHIQWEDDDKEISETAHVT